MNISKHQLADMLLQTQILSGHVWNIDEIVRRIICWPQKHVGMEIYKFPLFCLHNLYHDIISFTQVEEEVEESWVNSQKFLPPEEEVKSDSSDRQAEELLVV